MPLLPKSKWYQNLVQLSQPPWRWPVVRMHWKSKHHGWFILEDIKVVYVFKVLRGVTSLCSASVNVLWKFSGKTDLRTACWGRQWSLAGVCPGFIGSFAKHRIDLQGFLFLLLFFHAALYIWLECKSFCVHKLFFPLQSSLSLFIFIVLYIITCTQKECQRSLFLKKRDL